MRTCHLSDARAEEVDEVGVEVEVAQDLHLDPERGELRLLQLVIHSLDRHLRRGARVQESPKILIRFLNRLWFIVNLAKEQISIVVW